MPSRPLPPGLPAERALTVANRLNSAAIHLLRRISQEDAASGLTSARLSALAVLAYGGPLSLGELARREGVAAPTMSRIVEALVKGGLATRQVKTGDRRSVWLAPTPTGRKVMEQGRARRILRLGAELRKLKRKELETLEVAVGLLERLETQGGSR
jgi:DNA-binding MarR family transcriptional regulator